MTALLWYINRLRIMGAKEFFAMRLCRAARDFLAVSLPQAPSGLVLAVQPLDDSYREEFFCHFGSLRGGIANEAEQIAAHRITLFGREVEFGKAIDWHRDYVTGNRWSLGRDNYRTSRVGDPKHVWELNRQQFLPLLGKAYYLTGDERYAAEALLLITSWIEQNPPFQGVNWSSGIELALRQISWLWTLRFIAGSGRPNTGEAKVISASFHLQTAQIARNLSFYSSANNHLISELMAMSVVGGLLGEKNWQKESVRRLVEEIDRQIMSDGVGAEQSPSYQAHTTEYYLLYALAAKERGDVVPVGILRGLDRAAAFLDAILDWNGYPPPPLCDSDSGVVLPLGERYSNYKTILNLTGFVSGNSRHIRDDVALDEKSFWLVGPEAFRTLVQKGEARSLNQGAKGFDKGGYYILDGRLNGREVRALFDCGPLGMPPMAAHGHADALQFLLYIDGFPILIDPNTFTYFGGGFWRDYFRGTSAHNTLRIDGEDQSRFVGKFLSLRQAKAECREWVVGERVTGGHDGYLSLPSPVEHQRTLSLDKKKGLLRIEDRLITEGKHLVEIFFHLDTTCRLFPGDDNRFKIKSPAGDTTLTFDRGLEPQIYYGDSVLPMGWQSRCYGSKERTITLVGRKLIYGSTQITTEIAF